MSKKIFSVVLALLLLVCVLSSCKGNGNKGDDTNNVPLENIEVDLSEYRIVYSKENSSVAKKQASELQAIIKNAVSIEPELTKDDEDNAQDKEILVGMTDREQSADIYKKINGRGYAIGVIGEKIIITAYDGELLSEAFVYFGEAYLKNSNGTKLTLSATLCYVSEPVITTDIIKDGEAIYSIVRSEEANYNITECAKGLYNTISQLTGVSINLTTDYLKKGEVADSNSLEILIGETNRPESQQAKETLNSNEYAIQKIGNKIVIIGASDALTVRARDAFIDIVRDSLGYTVDGKCDLLLKNDIYKNDIGNLSWLVNIPQYTSGKLGGIADVSEDAYELFYTDTTAEEFGKYCEALEGQSYTLYAKNEINGNLYRSYYKDNKELVYTYYTKKDNSVRIIVSPFNDGLLPLTFEATNKVTDFSVTQLKLDFANSGNGMSYIITLEDGSFIIIDGGSAGNSSCKNADWLHQKLQALNKREGTPVIAAWYLTHIHQDHCGAFADFATKYGSQYILEYAIHNLPTKYIGDRDSDNLQSKFYENGKYAKAVNAFVGEAKTVRVHTGMKFNIHGAEFEVLYTWEDCFPTGVETQNDCSVVTKMTLAGQTFFWTGDIQKQASDIIMENFGSYVKSDYLQLAHHGWANGGSWELYRAVDPTVVFWSTTTEGFNEQSQSNGPSGQLLQAETAKMHIVSEEGDKTLVLPYTP